MLILILVVNHCSVITVTFTVIRHLASCKLNKVRENEKKNDAVTVVEMTS